MPGAGRAGAGRRVFINVARGSVVDQDALVAALAERRILAAGLDVYADEPNVPEALVAMEQVVSAPASGLRVGADARGDGQAGGR